MIMLLALRISLTEVARRATAATAVCMVQGHDASTAMMDPRGARSTLHSGTRTFIDVSYL